MSLAHQQHSAGIGQIVPEATTWINSVYCTAYAWQCIAQLCMAVYIAQLVLHSYACAAVGSSFRCGIHLERQETILIRVKLIQKLLGVTFGL